MNSLESSSRICISGFGSSGEYLRICVIEFMMKSIVFYLLITGKALDLVNFIDSSLTIDFKFIRKKEYNFLDFILNKLKGLFNFVLFCQFCVECMYISNWLFKRC